MPRIQSPERATQPECLLDGTPLQGSGSRSWQNPGAAPLAALGRPFGACLDGTASREVIVVGNPGGRRVALLQEALARLDRPRARIVPWVDLLAGRVELHESVPPGAIVRLDSPGKDFEVERALLRAGIAPARAEGSSHATRAEIDALTYDRGRILWPRQRYLGFVEALRLVERQLVEAPPHLLVGDPAEIAVMFDKEATHARLSSASVPVPRALPRVETFDALEEAMRASRVRRVFVKLAHGSSASGAVAYRTDGRRHRAWTTVEEADGHLYNSRRVRVLSTREEVARVVEALGPHRLHVEEWLPKAGLDGRAFDLRVLVVAGRARHVVVRLSRTPMTNLHLLNARGSLSSLRERMAEADLDAVIESCELAAACFPRSLHAGVDVMVLPGYRRHAVLEVNAFGDLLPGVLHEGKDAYETELEACSTPRG